MMTHRLTVLFCSLLALISLAACKKDFAGDYADEYGPLEGIVLTFQCEGAVSTRTRTVEERPGVRDWNENRIRTLDIYMYREGYTSSDAIVHQHFTPNKDSTVTIPFNISDPEIAALAPSPNETFQVYAIANYSGERPLNTLTSTSLDTLKSLAITTEFAADATHKQQSFVMDGLSRVNIINRNAQLIARATVNLRRLAAKISVQIHVYDTISVQVMRIAGADTTYDTERWVPAISEMKVYLENGVKNTTMEGLPVENPVYFGYRSYQHSFTRSEAEADSVYCWVTDPTYCYPQRWEYGSKSSPTVEPDLKLLLPWTRLEENGHSAVKRQFYYKILFPDDERNTDEYVRRLVRNNWYKFKVDVGTLGSETDEASVSVPGHYYVVEWQDKEVVIKHAEIGHARFLSVAANTLTLNNEEYAKILYTSSHPVVIKDIVVTKPYYGSATTYKDSLGTASNTYALTVQTASANNAGSVYASGTKFVQYDTTQCKARNGGRQWVRIEGSHVVFDHALCNNLSSKNFDTAPYTISFTVIHKDQLNVANTVYQQRVTITQNPAMRIVTEANADSGNNHRGYVYVNNSNAAGTQGNYNTTTGALSLTSSDDNNNPNMYIITTSVLSPGSSYILADPRSDSIAVCFGNDANNDWAATAAAIEGGTRKLSWYHPASPDSSSQYLIAPSFRVASSYGKQNGALSYAEAQRRCASYQESGYPAGRWRLPTRAEIEYMITLSSQGHIRSLFTPDSSPSKGGYWSSYGVVYPLNDGTVEYHVPSEAQQYNNNKNWPRCVYDDWYWGSETVNLTTFTWGDRQ